MASELWGTLRFVDMDIFHDLHSKSGTTVFNNDLIFSPHIFWLSVKNAKDYISLYGYFYRLVAFNLTDEVDLSPMWLFLDHLRIVSMKNSFSALDYIEAYTTLYAVGQRRTVHSTFTSITEESLTSGFGYKWEKTEHRTTSFSGFLHPMIALSPLLI